MTALERFRADELDALEAVCAKATPGEWKACGTIYEHMNAEIRSGRKGEGQAIAQVWDGPNAFPDAQHIAAMSPATSQRLIAMARESLDGGWMPIETAPRDGTRIIAYQPHFGVYDAWWELNEPEWVDWQNEADSEPAPTLWMPMPPVTTTRQVAGDDAGGAG